ncbi:Protein of uncharacterised function (DUF2648) [Staphylococcus aureus]|nr:Protein of uncharacterised function (DUF2648) [Staphylococcus aureus]CAC6663728.1 Protein of uncharacterised function (DUF2648) [Staphylococcus aureus]
MMKKLAVILTLVGGLYYAFKKYVKKCIIKTYNLIELSFNTS